MRGLVIALLGREEVGRELGKRGTATDISYYNSKHGDVVHTVLHPSRYPQSLQPLGNILGVAQEVVFDIQELGPTTGEQIIAASHAGHTRARVVLGDMVGDDDVLPLFRDVGMEVVFHDDVRELRESIESIVPVEAPGIDLTVVDQCFSVKGVGTVALGFTMSGVLRKHGELVVSPGGARAIVRSIQVQDEDQSEVLPFTRVGLALRGVEPEQVGKGSVLSSTVVSSVSSLEVELEVSKYWRGVVGEGMVLHLSSMFQFSPARVVGVAGKRVSLELEKPFLNVGGRVLVFHLDSAKQRVVGSFVV